MRAHKKLHVHQGLFQDFAQEGVNAKGGGGAKAPLGPFEINPVYILCV